MRVAITIAVIAAAIVTILAALFLWRLRALGRRVGSFECGVLSEGGWRAGIATYARDHLDWYKVVSLSVRPTQRWVRRELDIVSRERRKFADRTSQVSEAHCTYRGQAFVLAANDHALDGLTSWLEAAPPDTTHSRIV